MDISHVNIPTDQNQDPRELFRILAELKQKQEEKIRSIEERFFKTWNPRTKNAKVASLRQPINWEKLKTRKARKLSH